MKNLLALCAILLLTTLIGCSPDSVVTAPPDLLPAGMPGPATPVGEWAIDRLLYDQNDGQMYHVFGIILYTYAEDGAGFEFRTDAKLDVRRVHTPEPGGGSVIDVRSEKGSVAKSGKVALEQSYPLDGLHPAALLKVNYEVGAEGCALMDLRLIFRPIEAVTR
jgi:hypothetical protein